MKATLREPEIVTRKGKAVSVIIPIKDYEELLERAEDAEDVAELRTRTLTCKPPWALPWHWRNTSPTATASDHVSRPA